MPDPNQNPGALASQQVYGQGALQNGGQMPPQMPMPQPSFGDGLQGIGAWLQAANNPGGAASLLQGLQSKQQLALERQKMFMPQVVDGGTDTFTGMKKLMLVNPATGQTTQIDTNGQGGVSSAAPGSGGMEGFRTAMQQGVTGQDLMKYVPTEAQPYITALKNGTAIPGNLGRGGSGRQGLMMMAQAIYGPEMDEDNIAARQKAATSMNDPSVNQLGGQIQSANTLMNHNALLSNDIDNLEKLGATGKIPLWNKIKQGAEANIPGLIDQPTQAALASFDKHKQAVASELTRLTRGGNGSLQEVQDWKNGLNSSDSIAALRSSTAAVVDLMHGRVQSGVDTYNRAMKTNKSVEDYLSAPAQASIGKITGEAQQYSPDAPSQATAQGQTSVPAKGSVMFNSPSEVSAAVKAGKLKSGDKFTDPNGITRMIP